MVEEELNQLLTVTERTTNELVQGKDLITEELIQDFQSHYQNMQENAENIINPDRCIRVGVIGQVKAGKSSFLNALLFEGEDVLPKAATPMTAGLTKIVYSEHPYAKVQFYSESDWKSIEENSRQYDIELKIKCEEALARKKEQLRAERHTGFNKISAGVSNINVTLADWEEAQVKDLINEKYRSFKELTDMIQDHGDVDIHAKLGTEENIDIDTLAAYIGAEGKYAPLVKSLELGIDSQGIKDLEIIDTPGLGDPIVSRSQKTKEFLVNCDLVILLSRASQFMEQDDLQLLIKCLPENSINDAVIVASKFDSALLDAPYKRGDSQELIQVIKVTISKLKDSGRQQLKQCLQNNNQLRAVRAINQLLEKAEIRFTSAILYSSAQKKKNGIMLSEEEEHIIRTLSNRFPKMDDSAESLEDISGIKHFREKEFFPIADKKEKILRERREAFVSDQKIIFAKNLDMICNEARSNLRQLEEDDVTSIQKKIHEAQQAADLLRSNISSEFEECNTDIAWRLRTLSQDVCNLASNYSDIEIKRNEKTHHRVIKHWFSKNERWDELEVYYTASIVNVVENIHNYIDAADKLITSSLRNAIDINSVKNKIKGIVTDGFMQSGADFESGDIERPVQILLGRLTLPPFRFVDYQKYEKIIIEKFGDESVRDENMHRLKLEQTKLLGLLKDDYVQCFEKMEKDIKKILEEHSVTFIDNVLKQIVGRLEILKKNLQNKENSKVAYEEFIACLEKGKKELVALGRR